jgi:hypothetical protein
MDNRYSLYIDKVVELAETIVIKSVAAANSINQRLVEEHGPIVLDSYTPTSWKYYMNLAGEYHPTNQIMTVVSMDTQEIIVFSKENLEVHRATARGYVYGTRQYAELVAMYPDQEKLILGILYPVDKAAAISAPDGAILGYPAALVEQNEYNFIARLQEWINGFIARWVVRGFTITDPLYNATWMAILYVNLIPAILTIRLAACKTNEAHSFHVKKYLVSHGLDENHVDYLTLAQSLWLYRNIEYLLNNVGKQENFDRLVKNLMTKRNLPIADYTMRHNVTTMPDQVYPELMFRKKTLNYEDASLVPTVLTLEQLLDKQDQFARSNKVMKTNVLPVIQEAMENSSSNVLMTKFLESTVVDYGDGTPYTMFDVLIGHWPYLASRDLYGAFISVTNPRNDEKFTLSVKDAFALTCYAFAKAHGFTPEVVPEPLAQRVQRLPTPSIDDLLSVVDTTMVTRAEAMLMLSEQPQLKRMISTEAYYNLCQEIYAAEQLQRGMMALQEHPVKRAMMQNMAARIYGDAKCVLVPSNTRYDTWLAQRNIDLSSFSEADFNSMYQAIIQDATGLSLHAKVPIKVIQRAMVGLFRGLSSYSIQINAEVNSSDLIVMDTPAIRFGLDTAKMFDHQELQDAEAVIKDATTLQKHVVLYEINLPANKEVLSVRNHMGPVPVGPTMHLEIADNGVGTHMVYEIPTARLRFAEDLPGNDAGLVPVPGLNAWLALPLEQRLDVADMYDTGLPPVQPVSDYADPNDIDNVLQQKVLSGLKYDPDQQS